MLSYSLAAAEVAEHLAYHDVHGYSQPNRMGDGTHERIRLSDSTYATISGGDRDCSSLVCDCYIAAGLIDPDTWMWTGNEASILIGYGFARMPYTPYDLEIGDVLWQSGHTGIYIGDGWMVDAHGDEYHGISGPNVGDQTGHEIEVRSVLACNWQYVFRYEGEAQRYADAESWEVIPIEPITVEFIVQGDVMPEPTIHTGSVTHYDPGECVTIDGVAINDGFVWGSYIGGSGLRRYVPIAHMDVAKEV